MSNNNKDNYHWSGTIWLLSYSTSHVLLKIIQFALVLKHLYYMGFLSQILAPSYSTFCYEFASWLRLVQSVYFLPKG